MDTMDDIENIVISILKKLDVSYDSISKKESDQGNNYYEILSQEPTTLIGHAGETLQALHHLVVLILLKQEEVFHPFTIDVNGYLKENQEKIMQKVKVLSDRVVMFKMDVALEPSSSYERRIIHQYFSDHPQVATESRGDGRNRHVVLLFKEASDTAI